jgi:bacteriocin-type transport-associated protein
LRKVLFILGELSDSDIDWLANSGKRQQVATGEVLIEEGQAAPALYLVLDGHLGVFVKALGGSQIARLGSGEIVGEMSFVDARPPSATVRALEPSLVLAVPRSAIQAKLTADTGFASHFYRALAVFLSDRLRSTVAHLGYGKAQSLDEETEAEDELDPGVLDKVALAGTRFDWLLRRLRDGG